MILDDIYDNEPTEAEGSLLRKWFTERFSLLTAGAGLHVVQTPRHPESLNDPLCGPTELIEAQIDRSTYRCWRCPDRLTDLESESEADPMKAVRDLCR
jgi:hypothetical protein